MVRRLRTRWWAAAAILALVLAACPADDPEVADPGDDPPPAEVPDTISILEWAGYELEEFYPRFIEEYPDVRIDFQFGDSDADFLTLVETGAASPSVVHPCAGWVGLWVDAGLAQPIDTDKLTNWDSLDPAMRDLGLIDGEYYFVPFDWGYTSMAVAVDRVDEVPTSWQDLWDPQYAGRIALWDDPEEAVVFTSYAWGLDPYDLDDEELAFVREKLEELVANTKTFWTSSFELNALLIDGEVDVAQAWTEAHAAMIEAGQESAYVDPEEGRLGWVCGYIVLEEPGTPAYDLAHDFIDAALDVEAGTYLVNEYYYGHSNVETIDAADQEVVELIELDRLDIRERTNFFEPITEQQREAWARMWAEVTG
jgi:spermidine/putrescine transport system substrate-binding protein